MNDPGPASQASTPWHLWVIAVIALLWNSMGAYDYLMTETRNSSYMSAFTPAQLAYFYSFPAWVIATWALSVWGGVLGSIALLLRRRWAVPVFAISLVTLVATFFHNFVLSNGAAVIGGAGGFVFSAAIFLVAVALLIYARRLARKGTLR
jgi:hypothetical protein